MHELTCNDIYCKKNMMQMLMQEEMIHEYETN